MTDPTAPVFSPDAEEEHRLRQQTLRAAETLAAGGEVGSLPVVVANLLSMYEQQRGETERLQAEMAKEKAESYRLREHGLTLIRERDQVSRERDGLAGGMAQSVQGSRQVPRGAERRTRPARRDVILVGPGTWPALTATAFASKTERRHR